MPQPFGDHLGVDAGPQRQGGMGMPQVVESDLGQHRLAHRDAKVARHILRMQRLAVLLGKHQAGVDPGLAPFRLFGKLARGLSLYLERAR